MGLVSFGAYVCGGLFLKTITEPADIVGTYTQTPAMRFGENVRACFFCCARACVFPWRKKFEVLTSVHKCHHERPLRGSCSSRLCAICVLPLSGVLKKRAIVFSWCDLAIGKGR